VPLVLMLEGFAAAPMMPKAAKLARWQVLLPIMIAAALCIPLGTLLLTEVDPQWIRRGTALIVLSFSLVLLTGARWQGRYRTGTGLALGSVSGTMLGATSIGGPPVILYLLSGPDSAATTRANLTLYVAVSSVLGLSVLTLRGAVSLEVFTLGLVMAPLFTGGVMVGSRIFAHLSEQRFRRITILLMLCVSAYVLLS
jgi:uncharacterized protein